MKSMAYGVTFAIALSGCASADRYLRPEGSFYVPQPAAIDDLKLKVQGTDIKLNCLDKDGNASVRSAANSADIQCLYYSAKVTDLLPAFEEAPAGVDLANRRNHFMSFLLNIADQNCETFLNRAFANKSSVDTTKNTIQDILTGTSAATANAAPPTAAGLSLANLMLGKTVDNINSTFFFEKTFQAIGSAIYLERSDIREQISKRAVQPYPKYTVFDVLTDVRRYESACSIRVGVSRLQSLAEDRARERIESEKRHLALVEVISQRQNAEAQITKLEQEKNQATKTAAEKQEIEKEVAKLKAEKEKADKQIAALQEAAKATAEQKAATATADFAQAQKQAELVATKSPPPAATAVPPAAAVPVRPEPK